MPTRTREHQHLERALAPRHLSAANLLTPPFLIYCLDHLSKCERPRGLLPEALPAQHRLPAPHCRRVSRQLCGLTSCAD